MFLHHVRRSATCVIVVWKISDSARPFKRRVVTRRRLKKIQIRLFRNVVCRNSPEYLTLWNLVLTQEMNELGTLRCLATGRMQLYGDVFDISHPSTSVITWLCCQHRTCSNSSWDLSVCLVSVYVCLPRVCLSVCLSSSCLSVYPVTVHLPVCLVSAWKIT